MRATLQHNEEERLEALRRYEILDTLPEKDFDDLTGLASQICGTPTALISLIDNDRQWFKSKVGFATTETSRETAFCAQAIRQHDLFIIRDTLHDKRFAGNPLVTSKPHIRFYAGAPLITPEGHALGTLCVLDRVPRELSAEQRQALLALGRQVMTQLELRRQSARLTQANEELQREVDERTRAEAARQKSDERYRQVVDEAEEITHKGNVLMASTKFRRVLTRAIVVPLVLMVVLAGVLLWQIKHLSDKAQWIDHTDQVIAQANYVRNLLVDMETGERGYLLTDNRQFLEPYTRAVPEIDSSFERLSNLVSDNPPQVERLTEIQSLSKQWRDFACQLTVIREQGGDYQALVNGGAGKRLMDAMRTKFADFLLTEESLRDERISASQQAKVSLGIGIGLTLLMGVILAFFARRQLVMMSRGYGRALAVTRQQTELLRTQQEFLSEVINTNPSLIFVKDWDGRFTLANRAIAALYGTSPQELVGKTDGDFNSNPEEVERFLEDDREVIRTKLPKFIPEESVTNAGTGEVRWFQTIKVPLNSDGNGVQVLGVSTDITERKRAEDALSDSEEQLRQAQKLESIGTLAGGVAHDFNNLLTVISGNTQLALARLQPDAPILPRLVEIDNAADRAATLTRQLLAFSRRQQLERKTINLNETIHEIMKLLRRIIGEDVEVRFHTATSLAPIFADPSQIEQVVMNLAINARDAMPQGGRLLIETQEVTLDHVYLHNHPLARPGRYAEISVSDTGIGMDDKTRARIFEPFFTTKGIGKGTGLGLSMVYGIVKQHDGLIEVYSEVGQGTIFKVCLPIIEVAVAEEKGQTLLPLRGGTETILVAEDEGPLRVLAESVLSELGYTVRLACNGEEAVEIYAANQEQIDLMILDVVMPRMGGHEVYEQVRSSGSEVPVIFMTGYSAEMVRGSFIEKTGTPLLQKPYSVEMFGRKVREVIDAAPKR